ncbi:hypothetical protein J6590_063438 [Homalodisca vitripennis]|nr:hypothetical protein J6590_063438 [Homalodisca vitripennis]
MDRTSTSLWGEWMGVMHGDEIEYVFGHPLNMSLQYNARERDLSLRIMQAYSKFALTGKPVSDDINWPIYSREQPQYYIFNAEKSGIGKGPRATACAFWNDFLPRLRGQPDPECVVDPTDTETSSPLVNTEPDSAATRHLSVATGLRRTLRHRASTRRRLYWQLTLSAVAEQCTHSGQCALAYHCN